MSVEVKGMQELINYFDKIGNKKVPRKALKDAGDYVLKVERAVAQREHYKYSKHIGYKHLKRFPARIYKSKGYVDIGIKGSKVDFNLVKGLYYNHYGFHHNGWHKKNTRENRLKNNQKSGKYVSGSRWMDSAYDESVEEAYKILEERLLEGVL